MVNTENLFPRLVVSLSILALGTVIGYQIGGTTGAVVGGVFGGMAGSRVSDLMLSNRQTRGIVS